VSNYTRHGGVGCRVATHDEFYFFFLNLYLNLAAAFLPFFVYGKYLIPLLVLTFGILSPSNYYKKRKSAGFPAVGLSSSE
jgi:hypothetical protein